MVEENEENLEGFEESESKEAPQAPNRPDIRLVQVDTDREGKSVYKNVGGMWKNVSRNGNEFYTVKIGNLKLLAFPNTPK